MEPFPAFDGSEDGVIDQSANSGNVAGAPSGVDQLPRRTRARAATIYSEAEADFHPLYVNNLPSDLLSRPNFAQESRFYRGVELPTNPGVTNLFHRSQSRRNLQSFRGEEANSSDPHTLSRSQSRQDLQSLAIQEFSSIVPRSFTRSQSYQNLQPLVAEGGELSEPLLPSTSYTPPNPAQHSEINPTLERILREFEHRNRGEHTRSLSQRSEREVGPALPTLAEMASMYSGLYDNGTPAPRNPPGQPMPSQNQPVQQNGIGQPSGVNSGQNNGINGSGAIGGPSGSFVPTPAGHQSDLNYIWEQLESLAGVLKGNREGIAEVMARAQETTENLSRRVATNQEGNPEGSQAQIAELAGELLTAQNTLTRKERELGNTKELLEEALTCLSKILEMVRKFAYENQMHIAGIHRSYQGHLNREREINMELRNQEMERLAGIARIGGYVREMSRIESERPWHAEMAALKEENRILKLTLGWEASDGEGEEEREEQGQE
ncbi:MAG: hypothetical protein M1814_005472 [Vezdaea aestivalis]|nr:MAG: hypothetical protein M1814_005472 [Vezdaea aestivalis]